MQNQRMLQARHRYLQARRDLEYDQLREKEMRDAAMAQALRGRAPKVLEKDAAAIACANCGKEFKLKAGLSSHLRNKTCEGK